MRDTADDRTALPVMSPGPGRAGCLDALPEHRSTAEEAGASAKRQKAKSARDSVVTAWLSQSHH